MILDLNKQNVEIQLMNQMLFLPSPCISLLDQRKVKLVAKVPLLTYDSSETWMFQFQV